MKTAVFETIGSERGPVGVSPTTSHINTTMSRRGAEYIGGVDVHTINGDVIPLAYFVCEHEAERDQQLRVEFDKVVAILDEAMGDRPINIKLGAPDHEDLGHFEGER